MVVKSTVSHLSWYPLDEAIQVVWLKRELNTPFSCTSVKKKVLLKLLQISSIISYRKHFILLVMLDDHFSKTYQFALTLLALPKLFLKHQNY